MLPLTRPSKEKLRLWYEFCCLVAPEDWPYKSHPLRPRRKETFDGWLNRNREEFDMLPTHGLVEHKSPRDFEHHFIEGFHEVHVSINLYAPKAVIRREFERLLNERHTGEGFQHAATFMFNAPVQEKSLRRLLAVLRASREGLTQVQIAEMVLGKKYKTRNAAAAAVSRDRSRGDAILQAIPSGRFPNPGKAAGGWIKNEEPKVAIQHKAM